MTTFAMSAKITFPKNTRRSETIILQRVTEIELESSWKEITSRGTLTMPKKYPSNIKFSRINFYESFKRGDEIKIEFGYDGNNVVEFEGYISNVSSNIPAVISFEDEMYKIRKIPVNFVSKNTTLENLLKKIIPNYEIDCLSDVQLGAVKLAKTAVGPTLEKLQSEWGLYTYMRGKTIVCGKYYADDSAYKPVNFHLERNCISPALNYKKKDDISLKIKCISTLKNGTKITVENIGDKDGDERQLSFYNIEIKEELERLGKLEYEKFKQDRFDGSFTAFGIPSVKHGMKVILRSEIYKDDFGKSDRDGTYYVEKVSKRFSSEGIRQEITIGDKV